MASTLKRFWIVFVLTMIIWVVFRILYPNNALSQSETNVVVAILFLAAAAWTYLAGMFAQKKTKKNESKKGGDIALVISFLVAINSNALATVPPDPIIVVCRAERSVVEPFDSVRLRALPSDNRKIVTSWTVPVGKVKKLANGTMWILGGAQTGDYIVNCTWILAEDPTISGTASLSIMVVPKGRSLQYKAGDNSHLGPSLLARSWLEGQRPEERGFGLYSYLLFRVPPSQANKERYRLAIQEYLRSITQVNVLQVYEPDRSKLNVAYLPVVKPTQGLRTSYLQTNATTNINELTPDQIDDDFVQNRYNYPRAMVYLSKMPEITGDGPFIICSRKPLSQWTQQDDAIVQNMSTVPPRLINLWINEYITQCTQQRLWQDNTLSLLPLRIRTGVSLLAEGMPDVKAALESWIKWSKGSN
ncbi:hypothetical protein [Hymenobacter sp. GOD-10R]|uniref:hypothetical protein n=1 Tax=Hymenobacter sp. GOD-10R TaxID=3093922 RepID=UPI002D79D510|nr:hypothetical protein [Hymenobacter sp. GOD-10R]WRQ32007.1 hypothetical protein SD425_29825 [Hymenobacter sp. GOD-10R]